MLAWHFLPEDRHTRWNRTLVEVGQTLTWDGPLVLCESGLHASIKALDALVYAPGPVVCRVKLGGKIVQGDDKLCASKRTVIAMADASQTLRDFARWCAIQVTDKWNCPEVVKQWLMTGNPSLQSAARSAARSAADSAADSAAPLAAYSAAYLAARSAARSAADSAADSVARLAADSVARSKQNVQLDVMLKTLLECE